MCALDDTGASVNLLGNAVADHLTSNGIEPESTNKLIRMANGIVVRPR